MQSLFLKDFDSIFSLQFHKKNQQKDMCKQNKMCQSG